MAKKKKASKRVTPEQAAERARPNWKAVHPIQPDAVRRAEADETAPEPEQVRRKYLGKVAAADKGTARNSKASNPSELTMVVMEPKAPSDARVGRKAVLVDQRGKIVGEQG